MKRSENGNQLQTDLWKKADIDSIILKNIEDGVCLIEADGRIVTFNNGAARITASSPKQALKKQWETIIRLIDKHGNALPDKQNPVLLSFSKQRTHRKHDVWILDRNQRKIALHLIVTPLMQDTKVKALILVMRDMSLEKQQEAAKTDFVSTASHEMRTPLATLEGYISLLLQQDLSAEGRKYATKAHQSVMHLGQLFKDLLTTTQSEDGLLSHHPQPFDLAKLLGRLVAEHQAQASKKNILLQVATPNTDTQFLGDPARISELITNVLSNALKYTQNDGEIKASLQETKRHWRIEIKDNGLGIAESDIKHVFQKFYRVDNNQDGTGLGLFICKQIAQLYQGDIWLESQLGKGSTFFINLAKQIKA